MGREIDRGREREGKDRELYYINTQLRAPAVTKRPGKKEKERVEKR